MRKVLLAVAGILLLGVGAAVGWFAAKRGTDATQSGNTPGRPAISYRADPELLTQAPSWEEWKYLGGNSVNFPSPRITVGEIEFGGMDRVVQVTQDDFEKVWAFYKKKCKLRDPGDIGSNRSSVGGDGQTVTIFDDIQAHTLEGPKSEGVQARGFSVQSLRYSLVGFVYRPKGGNATSILLVYRPNTEFIGLLKEKLDKD